MKNERNFAKPVIVSFGLYLVRIVEAGVSKITDRQGNRKVCDQTQVMPIMSPFGICKQYGVTGMKVGPLQRSFLENPVAGTTGLVSWYENGDRVSERATIVEVLRDDKSVTGFSVEFADGAVRDINKNMWTSLKLKAVEGAFSGKPGWYVAEFKVNAKSFNPEDIAEAIQRRKYVFEPVEWLADDFADEAKGATVIAKVAQQLFATTRIRPSDDFEVDIEDVKGKSIVTCTGVDIEDNELVYQVRGEDYGVDISAAQMLRYKPAHLLRDKDPQVTTIPVSSLNAFELKNLEANEIDLSSGQVEYALIQQINSIVLVKPRYTKEEFLALAKR